MDGNQTRGDSVSTTDTAAVTRARLAKAQAIAGVLDRAGAVASDVLLIDAPGRRAAEQLAGVRTGSDETWQMVADILGATHAVLARYACDPFEGLT